MKQVYATGQWTATTLEGPASGYALPTLRASSSGLQPDEVQTALTLASYTIPPRPADSPRPLPVRLALFRTPATGRVLTHIAPNSNGFFAHTLLNVPSTADAQLAIQTWGSPLWQRTEPHSNAELPELPYLPVSDQLDDANLREWLQSPARQELLEFVLAALLGTASTGKIFLGAAADDVARVVYAVARSLPQSLLEDFTFSTYESDPLNCPARLIGCEPPEEGQNWPEGYSTTGHVCFNTVTGQRSDLPQEVPFARFATKCLASGEIAALDELKSTWQRLGLQQARHWDLVYRMARGTGVLSQAEAAEALQHPPMAAWLATRADVLKQFLEWALESREFATDSFSRAAQALRQKSETLAKVAQSVREQVLKAIKAGECARAANALEVILPVVAPSKANAIWGEIMAQIPDPAALSWAMRWYLLPRLVRFKATQTNSEVDPTLLPWLTGPAEKLAELLALDLPRSHQLAAGRQVLLLQPDQVSTLVDTVGRHPSLALGLLQPSGAVQSADCVRLFEGLLSQVQQHPWLEELLQQAANYPTELLNKFFESALAAGRVEADRLIRSQGDRLLQLFAGQSGLDRVGTQFLAVPPADLLHAPGLLSFLDRLRQEPQVSPELQARIAHVQMVRRYLDQPELSREPMQAMAAAMRATPSVLPVATKTELLEAVVGALVRQAADESFQQQLETVLIELGSVLANDPVDLFENLLRSIRTRTDFPRHENLVPTFLGLALGAIQNPELIGKLDGLESQAFALAAEAAKRGGNPLLRIIDRRSESWPKAARTQWGFLSAAVRPRGWSGFVRDLACFLIGMVVASAAWGLWSLVK